MSAKTILLLEDEALIAMDIAMELESVGFEVIHAATIAEALTALDGKSIDAGILDLDIRGVQTTVVAEAMRARKIPFVVCSGSQFPTIAEIFSGVPMIAKPYRPQDLHSSVLGILEARA